ncbi:MAG: diguanylate cyclase with sensor [Caproiciproducens sp.]|nr:diguanylate cyclase with sensor [Caproiciproducens sp.]
MKIRKYLTTVLAVFSIVPIVLIMVFSVEFFRRNSAELLQTNVRNVAEQAVENVDQFFGQRKMALEVASDLPQVKQLLVCSNLNGPAKDQTLYRNNAIELFKTMTVKQTINGEGNLQGNYVRRSSLINQRGIVIASDDSSLMGRASFLKIDMRTIPAYGMYISDIIQNQDFINGQKYFVIAIPVYFDGVYQGFIQSSIDMYYFNTVISQGFMETGSTVIIDSKGNLAGDKNTSFVSNTGKIQIDNDFYNQNLKKIDLDKNPNGVISFKVNGNERFGYYSRVAGKDWLIISTIEQACPLRSRAWKRATTLPGCLWATRVSLRIWRLPLTI